MAKDHKKYVFFSDPFPKTLIAVQIFMTTNVMEMMMVMVMTVVIVMIMVMIMVMGIHTYPELEVGEDGDPGEGGEGEISGSF